MANKRLTANELVKREQPNCRNHPDRKAEQWAVLLNPIWDESNSGGWVIIGFCRECEIKHLELLKIFGVNNERADK